MGSHTPTGSTTTSTSTTKSGPNNASLERLLTGLSNRRLSKPAHALPYAALIADLDANAEDGLTEAEARLRLELQGRNELGDDKGVQPTRIIVRQIANAMMLVLLLAMAASFSIKSWIEGGVVALVIILNIVVGFNQEYRAERTMESLRTLSSPTANVVRDGQNRTIPTGEVVPGDMVELVTGDTVPADIRLIEAANFETDEALLTGESLPVRKDAEGKYPVDTGPGDRLNVAFCSSTVTKGRARGIVFATGLSSEIGSIASALRSSNNIIRQVKRDSDGRAHAHHYLKAWGLTAYDAIGRFLGVNVGTPLQKKLSRLAILLFGIAIACTIIVLGANKFSREQEVIIYAVATGLSMIPASLIVVLTITMAAGTKTMVKRNVIVRNVKALESLGSVTDICSDKTGTITQGKMIVARVWVAGPKGGTYSVDGAHDPFCPWQGTVSLTAAAPTDVDEDNIGEEVNSQSSLQNNAALEEFLNISSLANLAHVHKTKENRWVGRGDPTEIAIQVFASRFDWNRSRWRVGTSPIWTQLAEFPFDSDVKRMSVIYENTQTHKRHLFAKGAVERILNCCSWMPSSSSEGYKLMTDEAREFVLEQMEALAARGLRTLALASRELTEIVELDGEIDRSEVEKDLIFRGLYGIYDPPRGQSAGAVKECHDAGIVVHMLTGDHLSTATAIAKEVGILPPEDNTRGKQAMDAMVMSAQQFDGMTDVEIDKLPELPLVIARCAPSTKVRMIEALHRRRKFAAMTGDGVNDSPSLKRADVGIAMGQGGSDVAKDASDIILSDDNFASIINAIEEGRRMFCNIQKFVLHLLAQNVAQAIVLLCGLGFKDSTGYSVFPISPVEVMFIIMVTSSTPDMGLGFEAAGVDIMREPPRDLKRGVFTLEVLLDMIVYGVWISILCLSAFTLVLYGFGRGSLGQNCNDRWSDACNEVFRARATTFACLTWFSLFLAWELVDMRRSFFMMQNGKNKRFWQVLWANKFLFFSVIVGFVTIFPVVYIPVVNRQVFKHAEISWEWVVVLFETALFFVGVEGWKWAKRVYFRRKMQRDDLESLSGVWEKPFRFLMRSILPAW